jgi:hypothetical protein
VNPPANGVFEPLARLRNRGARVRIHPAMPETLHIVKARGTEPWSDDHAIGTMVIAGVEPTIAVDTVRRARALMRELDVRAIPSKTWTIASEELRRGNLVAAAKILIPLSHVEPPMLAEPPSEEVPTIRHPDAHYAQMIETVARTRRTDAYAHVQANDAFFAATVAASSPALGLVVARFHEVADLVTLAAGRSEVPGLLRAFTNVVARANVDVSSGALADLKRRLYALTSTAKHANVVTMAHGVRALAQRLSAEGVLGVGALDLALAGTTKLLCPLPFPPPIPLVPDVLSPHRPTSDEVGQTRERPIVRAPVDLGGLSRPRERDQTDPRDGPVPPVYGEEIDPDMVYARWTAIEWPPFIRPDDHSLFCHQPLRPDQGDRTKVMDGPGTYALTKANPKALALRHVLDKWEPRVGEYWQKYPEKMQLIPRTDYTWVDLFVVETSDTDEPSDLLKDLDARIREQLEKEETKERLERAIANGLDSLVGDMQVYGVPVSSVVSGASKMLASAVITFVSWLLDQVMGSEAFQEIIVTHRTAQGGDCLRSWVTYGTRDPDSGEAAAVVDPRMEDPNQPFLATTRISQHRGFLASVDLDVAGAYWENESAVPDRLPADVNALFKLPNAVFGAIFWPPHMNYGAHVFLPVRARHDDSVYCIALRTEVRAVHVPPA